MRAHNIIDRDEHSCGLTPKFSCRASNKSERAARATKEPCLLQRTLGGWRDGPGTAVACNCLIKAAAERATLYVAAYKVKLTEGNAAIMATGFSLRPVLSFSAERDARKDSTA